jgi:hypothetical protein
MVATGIQSHRIQMAQKLSPLIVAVTSGLPLIQEQRGRHAEQAVRCITGMLWLQAAMEII